MGIINKIKEYLAQEVVIIPEIEIKTPAFISKLKDIRMPKFSSTSEFIDELVNKFKFKNIPKSINIDNPPQGGSGVFKKLTGGSVDNLTGKTPLKSEGISSQKENGQLKYNTEPIWSDDYKLYNDYTKPLPKSSDEIKAKLASYKQKRGDEHQVANAAEWDSKIFESQPTPPTPEPNLERVNRKLTPVQKLIILGQQLCKKHNVHFVMKLMKSGDIEHYEFEVPDASHYLHDINNNRSKLTAYIRGLNDILAKISKKKMLNQSEYKFLSDINNWNNW